jgi:hypothetical protein
MSQPPTRNSLYRRAFRAFLTLSDNPFLIPVEDQHVHGRARKRLRHGEPVAERQAGMVQPLDDFADDVAVLGIVLQNCDAHDDSAGKSEIAEADYG